MLNITFLDSTAVDPHDLEPVLEPAVSAADHASDELAPGLVGVLVHARDVGTRPALDGRVGWVLVALGRVTGTGFPCGHDLACAALSGRSAVGALAVGRVGSVVGQELVVGSYVFTVAGHLAPESETGISDEL